LSWNTIKKFLVWTKQISFSAAILSILFFIVINFYLFASIVNLTTFLYIFLLLSILTDGLFILVQVFRRRVDHEYLSCDPKKLTILIACYNGADIIGETIEQAKKHVPANQIVVVSDASTDNTAEIARGLGATVIENKINLNKAFSINKAVAHVNTPYVLLLDDDVLIGDATIPTNLLDEGYTAVAFNVMPVEEDKLVTKLQTFEYRNSMQVGKNLRGNVGAIGNISGAIGLYKTTDLKRQASLHSGQFAGEDEQRTILAQIYGEGKGITYTNETVTTHVPPSFKALYRQRAYSWSLAVPELFTLYWRILLSPRYHYLLKAEKAYYLYIYLTDPLRLLFLWALVLRPQHMILTYVFYLTFSLVIWLRIGAKDKLSVVAIYPLYKLWLTISRFVGNFYWFKVKALYLRDKLHLLVTKRKLIPEYILVMAVFVGLWAMSIQHFATDMQLYSKIKSNRLDDPIKPFEYEEIQYESAVDTKSLNIKQKASLPAEGTFFAIGVEEGDTDRAIAHKAVEKIIESRSDIKVPYKMRSGIDASVLEKLQAEGVYITPTSAVMIEESMVESTILQALENAKTKTGSTVNTGDSQ